jgi:hypothetical protein
MALYKHDSIVTIPELHGIPKAPTARLVRRSTKRSLRHWLGLSLFFVSCGKRTGIVSCFSLSLRFPLASHVEGSSLTTSLRYQDAVLAASYIYS